MPMSGQGQFKKLAGDLRSIGDRNSPAQTRLLTPAKKNIRELLTHEFADSVDPSGRTWQPTKRGSPALASRKLPQAFELAVRDGTIVGVGKSQRDLLDAHQTGWTFKQRQVAAHKQFLSFNSKGKLVAQRRIFKRKLVVVEGADGSLTPTYVRGELRRGAYQRFAAAHTVGERVLPERQIIPEGTDLPPPWEKAVADGLTSGMEAWHEKASK